MIARLLHCVPSHYEFVWHTVRCHSDAFSGKYSDVTCEGVDSLCSTCRGHHIQYTGLYQGLTSLLLSPAPQDKTVLALEINQQYHSCTFSSMYQYNVICGMYVVQVQQYDTAFGCCCPCHTSIVPVVFYT